MKYRCTHRHERTGHQCSRKARADWSTCGQHVDAGNPVVYHARTTGLRITIGRTRVATLDRKPEMIR